MKKILLTFLFLSVSFSINAQINNSSWRFYRPGNTGIQGDMATSLLIDDQGNPIIAANTGNWGEGGFAKFDQTQNKWINYSNVDLPVLGGFDNGDIQILDMVNDQNGNVWMAKMTGALKFNQNNSVPSIISYDFNNSQLQGISYDVDIAPDGSIWFANTELVKFIPSTNTWTSFGSSNINLSVQPKPDGSYIVWSAESYNGTVIQYNSITNTVVNYIPTNLGDIAALPGKDCVDDIGNFWALRFAENGDFNTLEYQKPNGEWVHPVHPYTNLTFYIDAFKAFGDKQAVLITITGEVWLFDGTNWNNYGTWRTGSNNTSIDIDSNGNVWVCGNGGAAKRDAISGQWQRYRITNTSQIDYFVEDLTIDNDKNIWMTGNAGTGVGGIQKFDGTKWTGFNPYTYGLGNDFPFEADNATAITCRKSTNDITFSPTFHGVHSWNGSQYSTLDSEMTTSKGLVEDSQDKLWSLGEYFNYKLYNDTNNQWTTLPIVGWGSKIIKDPTLPGTIWVSTDNEIKRTDGINILTLTNETIPNATGIFTGIAVDVNGILWTATWFPNQITGSSLIKYNSNTNQFQTWSYDNGWPFPGEHVRPFAVTPDGYVWMQYDSEYPSTDAGILAFDGTNISVFPSAIGGFPDWNVLPNSTIKDVEVKNLTDGYELWMSCLGRGIAVLKVVNSNLEITQINENTKPNLLIYPNPASENAIISLANLNIKNAKVSIYDIAGRLIRNLSEDDFSNYSSIQWDLKSSDGIKVSSGVYLIKLTLSNSIVNGKIIVK